MNILMKILLWGLYGLLGYGGLWVIAGTLSRIIKYNNLEGEGVVLLVLCVICWIIGSILIFTKVLLIVNLFLTIVIVFLAPFILFFLGKYIKWALEGL